MADLYLLGSGIRGFLHLTRETAQALAASRTAFVLHDDLTVHDAIRELCPDVRDLADHYDRCGADRMSVYRAIAITVVDAAAQRGPASLVVQGHPLLLVSAVEFVIELAQSRGLRTEVLPGISSFDTILCDLRRDLGYALQMFDATTMLQHEFAPNPMVPLLVYQLATLLSPRVTRDEVRPEVLAPLSRYLTTFYGTSHECTVVCSSGSPIEHADLVSTTIGRLPQEPGLELWRRPTLYVPPAGGRPIASF
jgi:hypothetical protein